jgi:hypothetical protein
LIWPEIDFSRLPQEIPTEFLTIPEVEEAMNELKHVSQDHEMKNAYNDYICQK